MDDQTPAGRVLDAAIAIAGSAPQTQNARVWQAMVPWHLIHELRQGLDALEIEWRRG